MNGDFVHHRPPTPPPLPAPTHRHRPLALNTACGRPMNTPIYSRWDVDVYHGDCLDVLSTLGDESVDSVVTDPPYALEFMGKMWDKYTPASYQAWCEKWATECLRVLKPGGHLLAFGGTRTSHRLACGIEDAGFELRDTITWMYSSGFPKSHDIGKAIDKAAGAVREITDRILTPYKVDLTASRSSSIHGSIDGDFSRQVNEDGYRYKEVTTPATEAAKQWDGWGTALKPASEPIIVARKLFKGTVAQNVLTHGTGGISIDGCRVPSDGAHKRAGVITKRTTVSGDERVGAGLGMYGAGSSFTATNHDGGRWPSNLVLSHASTVDGEDACADGCVPGCPVAELDTQSGTSNSTQRTGIRAGKTAGSLGAFAGQPHVVMGHDDSGGASRFYPVFRYQAKAPTSQRPVFDGRSHATVKPLALMRWLVRLVTPPGGLVLDPLCGTGTTGQACRAEGFKAILIEKEAEYLPLIKARLNALPKTKTETLLTDENAPKEDLDLFDLLSGEAS